MGGGSASPLASIVDWLVVDIKYESTGGFIIGRRWRRVTHYSSVADLPPSSGAVNQMRTHL